MRIKELNRINELARKAKTAGLNGAETAERIFCAKPISAKYAVRLTICCPPLPYSTPKATM